MNKRVSPPETRDFPTAAIASLSTGFLLCDFAIMHEAAEYLMGHPIWTHHFASEQLNQDIRRAIAEQCPGMWTREQGEGITRENWREYRAKLESEFGPTVHIRKGSGLTAMLPTDGIPDGVEVITIDRG